MGFFRHSLPQLPWTQGAHPLERKKPLADRPVTWLEFAPGFEDANWCRHGHAGLVVSGTFGLELETGTETLDAGEAFWVDSGTPHRARNAGPTPVVLFLVSRD